MLLSDWVDGPSDTERGDVQEDSLNSHRARGVKNCLPFWRSFCTNTWVLQWLEHGFNLWWQDGPAPRAHFVNHNSAKSHGSFVYSSIKDLLKAGAATRCQHTPHVVNPISVVPKKNGKLRFILDLRHVNKYLRTPRFKFERLQDLEYSLDSNDLMISIDLTNGYWQIPMHPDAHEFLGFEWEGHHYCFTVLPFGLASAPWCFAKVMRMFSGHLRLAGLRLLNYLDDYLFMLGSAKGSAMATRARILAEFHHAGLEINMDKSDLAMSTCIRSLGFMIDSKLGLFTVPQDRWDAFQAVCREVLRSKRVPARRLASLTGHAVSMSLALGTLPRLFTRACFGLLATKASWNSHLTVSEGVRTEVLFWANTTRVQYTAQIWKSAEVFQFTVATDASSNGWAGVMGTHVARGDFTPQEQATGSGQRELLAIHDTLLSFGHFIKGKRVALRTDSANAEAIIDHGSSKPHLQELALKVFWLAKSLHIDLSVTWVPREQNVEADMFSKRGDDNGWMLNPTIFEKLDSMWGPHTIDRFATHHNTMLPRFNSMFWCPGAEAVDCFAQDLSKDNNWCNPPFWLIPRLLQLLSQQRAEATLVVPLWPTRPWWTKLCPGGRLFGAFVIAYEELPCGPKLFAPGMAAANERGAGPPTWQVLAVRVSFKAGWQQRSRLATPLEGPAL